MPCYHPVAAWMHRELRTPNGKRLIVHEPNALFRADAEKIHHPCRQCIGCKLKKSSEWATRCVHEAQMHEQNCFITLTFSPEHVPYDYSLDKKHMQDFNKRLREHFTPKCPYPKGHELRDEWLKEHTIRTYYCGEYGTENGRPHYHGIYFNLDFPDKYHWRNTKLGHKVWRSPTLEKLWPFGNSEIGSVTFESAAYVARYICEKLTVSKGSSDADIAAYIKKYEYINPDTGEYFLRPPEFVEMSRRGGIGKSWFETYSSDVYPHDFVVIEGRKMPPPIYYDRQYELSHPMDFEWIKYERYLDSMANQDDNTPERLAVREQCKIAQIQNLKRKLGASNDT